MLIIYILLGIPILCGYMYLKYKRRFIHGNTFAGPPGIPIFGNVFQLLTRTPEELMEFYAINHEKYGSIIRVWLFHNIALVVSDTKVTEMILSNTKYNTKSKYYNFFAPWLGDGLLVSKGKKWQNRRKIITPAFHFKMLEQFVEIFDKQSGIFVGQIKPYDNGEAFDIYPYATAVALDIIFETAMGTTINAQTNSDSEYGKAVHTITRVWGERFAHVWQRNQFLFDTFARNTKRQQDEAVEILHNFTYNVIRKRRNKLIDDRQNRSIESKEDEFGMNKKRVFIDILLESTIDGVPLSNTDVREEVDTIVLGGHDTSTTCISFALYAIAKDKRIQNKLFEEIKEVLGTDKDTPVTYRNLQDMKYMELVIKETLRVYPPVPAIGRLIEADTPIDEYRTIPAGTNITFYLYRLMRDPKSFKDPDTFFPERFSLEENMENINQFAFLPFSAGPRNCVGQKFAMLELKAILSKVLRHYEVFPNGPEPAITIDTMLRSTNGIHIAMRPRKY